MKKILTITVTLALVLALAAITSAALPSGWTELLPEDVNDVENIGEISVSGTDIVLNTPAGSWWPQAGAVFDNKVAVNGFEFTIIFDSVNTEDTPNGFAGIILAKKKPGDFLTQGPAVSGRCPTPDAPYDTSLVVGLYGPKLVSVIDGSDTGFWAMDTAFTEDGVAQSFVGKLNAENTFKFVHAEGEAEYVFNIYLNGTLLQWKKDGVTKTLKADLTNCVDSDGKMYLALVSTGYGGAGSVSRITKINGVAATAWNGEAASNENPSSQGGSDVSIPASSTPAAGGCGNNA